MKWFKHYTNAHKGRVVHALIPAFGKSSAVGLYFLFVEYLTDKWDGTGEPEFKILSSELRSFLGLKQNKLSSFLVCLQNESDFSFKQTENFLEIKFPKLLEIRHRDALNASTRLEFNQHKSGVEKNKRKKNNKSITEWQQTAFDLLVAEYKKAFQSTEQGSSALARFVKQATTPEAAKAIVGSVANYKTYILSLTWAREPKTSVATYLGTEKSGFFWREYEKPKLVSVAAGSMRGE